MTMLLNTENHAFCWKICRCNTSLLLNLLLVYDVTLYYICLSLLTMYVHLSMCW